MTEEINVVEKCRFITSDGICKSPVNTKQKYCDEIPEEWCYYRQYMELEQENKELKEERQEIKSYLGINSKTILERLEELDEWKHEDKLLLWKYKSALEDIREICMSAISYDFEKEEILDKINEVLK